MIDESKVKSICAYILSCIRIIAVTLAKGDRIELIPVKDGVKIIHIKREEIRLKN